MPNKKKGFRRSSLSRSSVCQLKHKNRSAVRKQWTEEQMSAALNSVKTEGLSGNRAADLYGVPRSTLKDRLSGRVVHGTKPRPRPYLSTGEETELSSHLLKLRAGDSIASVRMDAVNAENIHTYFDLSVRSVYDEFGFDDHPKCTYNMDETGGPIRTSSP